MFLNAYLPPLDEGAGWQARAAAWEDELDQSTSRLDGILQIARRGCAPTPRCVVLGGGFNITLPAELPAITGSCIYNVRRQRESPQRAGRRALVLRMCVVFARLGLRVATPVGLRRRGHLLGYLESGPPEAWCLGSACPSGLCGDPIPVWSRICGSGATGRCASRTTTRCMGRCRRARLRFAPPRRRISAVLVGVFSPRRTSSDTDEECAAR